MTEHIAENIYSIKVPLPDNPLKWLNSYVIKAEDGKNLLIDTGFKRPECLEALLSGMKELGICPEDTDVFLTHVHSDHTGNAPALQQMGSRLIMSRIDHEVLMADTWAERKSRAYLEGMNPEVMKTVFDHNPATLYSPGPFEAELMEDGDLLSYGGHTLECIHTPGHTPGHMCLYEKESKTMFLGDHVLFDITPNICFWVEMENALGSYLESVKKIRQYEISLALPAHRNTGSITTEMRADQLLEHHRYRLSEALSLVKENPGVNAYDLTGLMRWKIRAKSWDDFPPGQKWFAMGECLAHLDYLTSSGEIERFWDESGFCCYK